MEIKLSTKYVLAIAKIRAGKFPPKHCKIRLMGKLYQMHPTDLVILNVESKYVEAFKKLVNVFRGQCYQYLRT
jgi:hypothetical protein